MLLQKNNSILRSSKTNLRNLKKWSDKITKQSNDHQKKIDQFENFLVEKLLSLIADDNPMLKVLNVNYHRDKKKTLLEALVEGTFDKENFILNKSYTVKIFTSIFPLVANKEQIDEILVDLNSFWVGQARLEITKDQTYCYFNFYWL